MLPSTYSIKLALVNTIIAYSHNSDWRVAVSWLHMPWGNDKKRKKKSSTCNCQIIWLGYLTRDANNVKN